VNLKFSIQELRSALLLIGTLVLASCDAGHVNLRIQDYSIIEGTSGNTELVLPVVIQGSVDDDVKVPISIVYISADQQDLKAYEKELIINKGQQSAQLKIEVNADTEVEKDESFYLKLDVSEHPGLRINNDVDVGVVKVVILNDDLSKFDSVSSKQVIAPSQAFKYGQPLQPSGRIIKVGPAGDFASMSDAVPSLQAGDTVEIDAAGKYLNDYAVLDKDNLTLIGVNGRPHLKSSKYINNGKGIWVVKGNNTRVINIEFSGARVSDRNGSAIRLEGDNLYIERCFFHDNENGLLTGNKKRGEVYITNSEFSSNGYGDGRSHNIYVGRIERFVIKDSLSKDAKIGHAIKSRARENYIMYNRLFESSSSYAIDISNGGEALVIGNQVYQGEETDNWAMVSFGAEGLKYEKNQLSFLYNSLQNDRSSAVFVKIKKGADAFVANNIFSGKGKPVKGKAVEAGNLQGDRIFASFNDLYLSIRNDKLVEVVDRAVSLKAIISSEYYPERHFVDGASINRVLTGTSYDVGAVEYHK